MRAPLVTLGLASIVGLSTIGCVGSGSPGKTMRVVGSGLSAVGKVADSGAFGLVGTGLSAAGKIVGLVEDEDEIPKPTKFHLRAPPAHIDERIFIYSNNDKSFNADMSGFTLVENVISANRRLGLGVRAVNRSGGGYMTRVFRDGELISNGYHVIGRGHEAPQEADVVFLIRPVSSKPLVAGHYEVDFGTFEKHGLSNEYVVYARSDFEVR